MKFAEISILYNKNKVLGKYLRSLFSYESYVENDTDVIISFDDGEMMHYNKTIPTTYIVDYKYNNYIQLLNKFGHNIFTYKQPYKINGMAKLNITYFFEKYKNGKIGAYPSYFNCVYEYNHSMAFCIMKIVNSDEYPRFALAFDETLIEKQDVIHIIRSVFMRKEYSDNRNSLKIADINDIHISSV